MEFVNIPVSTLSKLSGYEEEELKYLFPSGMDFSMTDLERYYCEITGPKGILSCYPGLEAMIRPMVESAIRNEDSLTIFTEKSLKIVSNAVLGANDRDTFNETVFCRAIQILSDPKKSYFFFHEGINGHSKVKPKELKEQFGLKSDPIRSLYREVRLAYDYLLKEDWFTILLTDYALLERLLKEYHQQGGNLDEIKLFLLRYGRLETASDHSHISEDWTIYSLRKEWERKTGLNDSKMRISQILRVLRTYLENHQGEIISSSPVTAKSRKHDYFKRITL